MHGAAHTAKAPPRRTREPRPRASCRRPAPTSRSGHGSKPMNASPKTTRTNPATRSSRNWSPRILPPTRAAPTPSKHEERREAEDERNAPGDHASRGSGLPELVGVDRRHGREVRRDERQDARREERDHAREESDGNRRPAHGSAVEACELVVHEALEFRVEPVSMPAARRAALGDSICGRVGRRRPRRRRARRAGAATRGDRSPRRAAPRAPPAPNCATSASLISCSESPAAMRTRMNVFMRSATGAFDWSSVVSQTGHTSSASRSAAFGGAAKAGPPAASAPTRTASAAARITSRAPRRSPRAARDGRPRRPPRP